jgi:hypothetical protein
MNTSRFLFTNISLALALSMAAQGASAQQRLNFVACPIIQDTDNVPCWLAEHEGELYFLGIQTDSGGWTSPLQGHKLLVEAVVTDNPRVCGGIVLASPGSVFDRRSSGSANGVVLPDPPVTSSLRELDNSCRTVLPEQPRFNTLEPRRGPGPSEAPPPRTPEQIAEAQRAAAARAEAERPRPPFTARTFELHYEFDSELAGLTINQLQAALQYAAAIGAKRMEVTGYRAAALLSNGEQIEELPAMARLRAQELETTIRMFGLPEGLELTVQWDEALQSGNGIDDWSRRKSAIVVSP